MNKYYQKDLYKILGVTPDADTAKIKSAYRKQARIWHPDVNDNSAESIARFKEITEAYEVLTDAQRRSQYDILKGFNTRNTYASREQSAKKAYSQSYSPSSKDRFAHSRYHYEYASQEDIKNSKNETSSNNNKAQNDSKSFSNVFENILDGLFSDKNNTHKEKSVQKKPEKKKQQENKQKKEKKKPENGRDINLNVNIKMHEAITGTNRTVNVLHSERCPKCEGRRFINGTKCPECKGTGEVSLHKKLNVRIPAGIKNGAKIRVANEGNKGYNGGKDGDLYLFVNIEENPFFKYDGLNVLCELPITPFEAVLGANIQIPTLCGNVSLKIPQNTTSGQKFRMSGQGIYDSKSKKRGDQIVTVKVEIPKHLSAKEIELYEQLKKLSTHNIRENLTNE